MADQNKPLPTHEEVLICTKDTTIEEVLNYYTHHNICFINFRFAYFGIVQSVLREKGNCSVLLMLINCHLVFLKRYLTTLKLLYKDQVVQINTDYCLYLSSYIGFRIVILISTKDQTKSHIASRLSLYLRKFPKLPSDEIIAAYVSSHISQSFDIETFTDQERFVH